MQIGYVLGDHLPSGVVPWALSDAIPRIHGGLAAASLRAEIGMPGLISSPGCLGQRLAMGVGPRQTAEIGALPRPSAGYKEGHGLRRLLLLRRLLGEQKGRAKRANR